MQIYNADSSSIQGGRSWGTASAGPLTLAYVILSQFIRFFSLLFSAIHSDDLLFHDYDNFIIMKLLLHCLNYSQYSILSQKIANAAF